MPARITAFFTALVVLLGSFSLLAEPKIPAACSESELLALNGIIKTKELGDEVFAVNIQGFSHEEKMTAIALQGIVAKTNPCIVLVHSWVDNTYLKEIKGAGKAVYTDNNGSPWTLAALITAFKDYIGDGGYTLYRAAKPAEERDSDWAEGLNVAVNYATAYGWLPIHTDLEGVAEACGLTKKLDISKDTYNIAFQKEHWEALKNHFTKGAVIHESYRMYGMRDVAIQQGFYCFYTDSGAEGNRFLKTVLEWSGKNTAVLGWTEDEKGFVTLISKMGCYINPTDICFNDSYYASFPVEIPDPNGNDAVAAADPAKHYVTLVFSDGDNCQWIQNGYGEYFTITENYSQAAVTYTFSSFLQELCPLAVKRVYSAANGNQYLAGGPSGIGYCTPAVYDAESMDLMSTRTAAAMLKSHQRVITILDDYTALKDARFAYRLGYFSRFDNIDGGILYLDPDGYRSGKGKIWFSNDKPFAGVRMSLWADGGYDGATDEWIREQAQIINNYPVDIHSVNGYSVICVHAWTMKPDSVQKFIDALDDHVVILNADDFLKTVQQNVPHKDAAPAECYK